MGYHGALYSCPICGEEDVSTYFLDDEGEILGCENCIRQMDAERYVEVYGDES